MERRIPFSFVAFLVRNVIELTWNASSPTWNVAFLVSFATFLAWNVIELTWNASSLTWNVAFLVSLVVFLVWNEAFPSWTISPLGAPCPIRAGEQIMRHAGQRARPRRSPSGWCRTGRLRRHAGGHLQYAGVQRPKQNPS